MARIHVNKGIFAAVVPYSRVRWLTSCPVTHYHVADLTCRAGGSGNELGSQNGPHYHVGSLTCTPGDPVTYQHPPDWCVRPHHHVSDPSWRAAP